MDGCLYRISKTGKILVGKIWIKDRKGKQSPLSKRLGEDTPIEK